MAIIYTDMLQMIIVVLGAIVLAMKGKSWGIVDPPDRRIHPSARFVDSEINKKTQSKQFGGQDAQQGFGLEQLPKGSLWSPVSPVSCATAFPLGEDAMKHPPWSLMWSSLPHILASSPCIREMDDTKCLMVKQHFQSCSGKLAVSL